MSVTQEKLLGELVEIVVKEGASDLHLSEGRPPVIRVSNFLIPLAKMPIMSTTDMAGFLAIFLSADGKREFESLKETNFAYSYKSGVRFRCNTFLTLGKTSIAMRLVPTEVKTFEQLGLPPILES